MKTRLRVINKYSEYVGKYSEIPPDKLEELKENTYKIFSMENMQLELQNGSILYMGENMIKDSIFIIDIDKE